MQSLLRFALMRRHLGLLTAAVSPPPHFMHVLLRCRAVQGGTKRHVQHTPCNVPYHATWHAT
eukprot:226898-Chlamydomonas_euryale.AAC.3